MGKLDGKSALVTGGGTGIGFGCAQRLAADGAAVTICGRREHVLERAAAELGPKAQWIRCDVTNEAQVSAAVAYASEPLGRLDIAVANAGGGSGALGPLVLTDIEQWHQGLALYMTGALLVIKHAARRMALSGSGSIVAVSSTGGRQTHRYLGQYCSAKAGVEMLVRNAADELGAYGVRVNAVRPGLVPTDMSAVLANDDAARADYLSQMPLNRLGTPDDVAAAVGFLACDDSSWMTGAILDVDGGQHLRRGANLNSIFDAMFDDALQDVLGPRP